MQVHWSKRREEEREEGENIKRVSVALSMLLSPIKGAFYGMGLDLIKKLHFNIKC